MGRGIGSVCLLPCHCFILPVISHTSAPKSTMAEVLCLAKCVVCLSALGKPSTCSMVRCGHFFHTKCINDWLKVGKSQLG